MAIPPQLVNTTSDEKMGSCVLFLGTIWTPANPYFVPKGDDANGGAHNKQKRQGCSSCQNSDADLRIGCWYDAEKGYDD